VPRTRSPCRGTRSHWTPWRSPGRMTPSPRRVLPIAAPAKLRVTSTQADHMPSHLRTCTRVLSSWGHGMDLRNSPAGGPTAHRRPASPQRRRPLQRADTRSAAAGFRTGPEARAAEDRTTGRHRQMIERLAQVVGRGRSLSFLVGEDARAVRGGRSRREPLGMAGSSHHGTDERVHRGRIASGCDGPEWSLSAAPWPRCCDWPRWSTVESRAVRSPRWPAGGMLAGNRGGRCLSRTRSWRSAASGPGGRGRPGRRCPRPRG
jgi:hypothetical protein